MPRAPRIQVEGGLFHITARGNRGQPIYSVETDFRLFLDIATSVIRRLGWICGAYCLMPNHYHLVVETPNADLSRGMHRLNSTYAHLFNERYGLQGHLFQARFGSRLIESSSHAFEVARYVVLNPVRASLCAHPAEWRWSSYRAMIGSESPEPLLAANSLVRHFASTDELARRSFVAFVRDGAAASARPAM